MRNLNGFGIISLDICITSSCPLRCDYCFEKKDECKDLDFDEFLPYLEQGNYLDFIVFGGEPLLKIDDVLKIHKKAEEKGKTVSRSMISNGALLHKHIEMIKKEDFIVQISIDGYKEIHDKHRKFADGSGSFDIILKNIRLCIENDVKISLHSVVSRDNFKYFFEIFKWFYELLSEYKSFDEIVNTFSNNFFFVMFEEEFNDDDVSVFLGEILKITEYIQELDIDDQQKKDLIKYMFERNGGVCSAGGIMFGVDGNLDLYPCHRLMLTQDKEKYKLGNLFKVEEFKNFKFYNSLNMQFSNPLIYSALTVNSRFLQPKLRWYNYCPATNKQTTDSIYYFNCKYDVLLTEYNRLIDYILEKYNYNKKEDENGKCGRPDNCS